MAAAITPFRYSLVLAGKGQRESIKGLSKDYPFQDLHNELEDHFVARTYLQFLWLPESIMPLDMLVLSLSRIRGSASSSPHPLHSLLEPLLLTTRSASNKYHFELPQILRDGGGAGEMEEIMMWYAVNYEKRPNGDDEPTRCDASNPPQGPWVDEGWRKSWLERMERREMQIQILLYLLKLSLPGPPLPNLSQPPNSPASSPKRSRGKAKSTIPVPSVEDQLESFMDKLSMWQLINGLDPGQNNASNNTRDWMQIFCEDIVEPQFKSTLPEQCSLLRSKVFPDSPFSDDGSDGDEDNNRDVNTPLDPLAKAHKDKDKSGPGLVRRATTSASSAAHPAQAKARSRSLSLSLAQDADARRAGSVDAHAKTRVLVREVSMSRVFKAKPPKASLDKDKGKGKARATRDAKADVVLPTATAGATTTLRKKPVGAERTVTLVAATPVRKHKIKDVSRPSQALPLPLPLPTTSRPRMFDLGEETRDGSEEIWEIPGSPDILLLEDMETTSVGVCKDEKDEQEEVGQMSILETPVKKGAKGRKGRKRR